MPDIPTRDEGPLWVLYLANGFAIADLSGNTLPNAPEFTAKLGVSWETQMNDGMLRIHGEVYHQDEVYFTEWTQGLEPE